MLEFLSYGYPMSFVIMIISFIVGMGVATIAAGTFSVVICMIISYFGIIKFMPLIAKIQTLFFTLWPQLKTMGLTLKDMYRVKGNAYNGRAIYLFHPHGSFSTSFFFHQMARVTSWPKEAYARATITYQYFWIPFAQEFLEALHAVPNRYRHMKEVLDGGESLAVIPGGLEELNKIKKKHLQIVLAKRKGVFRLALETGTPLVPVITYGENELYEIASHPILQWINQMLEKTIGIQSCIPSFESVKVWLKILSNGTSHTPVETVIGDPIMVKKKEVVKDEDIRVLKQQYIDALRGLYKKTKPDGYADTIEII